MSSQQHHHVATDPAEAHAAAAIREADERELLSALKAEAALRASSYKQDTGGQDPPRNSPPSLAAGTDESVSA